MANYKTAREREYRARRRSQIALMEQIACACGCGELIAPIDDHGRPKKIKQGHQTGNPQNLVRDGSVWRGRQHTEASRRKMAESLDQGSLSYGALHNWIHRHFARTGICEICRSKGRTEWANRDHSYETRARHAWLELCKSCHERYDIHVNGKSQGMAARKAVA